MWGRLGPRFAVEAGFLILVAVALGFADLRPLWIVIVMGVAWLLVSLIELIASRQSRYPVTVQRTAVSTTASGTAPAPASAPNAAAVAPAEAIAADPAQSLVGDATEEVPAEALTPAGAVGSEIERPARRGWLRRRKRLAGAPAGEVVEALPSEEPAPADLDALPAAGGEDRAHPAEEPASTDSSVPAGEADALPEPPRRRWLRHRERPGDPAVEQVAEEEPLAQDSPEIVAAGRPVSGDVVATEPGGETDRS